jgi:hypothetical protein
LVLVYRIDLFRSDDEVVVIDDNLNFIPWLQAGIPYPAYRQSNGDGALANTEYDPVNQLSH